MKIKENYRVREIAGEHLIVKQGDSHSDMTKVISLNNSAILLWNKLKREDFSLEDAANILMIHYDIPKEQAMIDANNWIDSLINCEIIE